MNSSPRQPVAKNYLDTSSTNITTGAWVTVIASISEPASGVDIFNGSGRLIKLAIGTAGTEDSNEIPMYVLPGGNSPITPLYSFPKGSRLAAKAVDASATTGLLVFNFFG